MDKIGFLTIVHKNELTWPFLDHVRSGNGKKRSQTEDRKKPSIYSSDPTSPPVIEEPYKVPQLHLHRHLIDHSCNFP